MKDVFGKEITQDSYFINIGTKRSGSIIFDVIRLGRVIKKNKSDKHKCNYFHIFQDSYYSCWSTKTKLKFNFNIKHDVFPLSGLEKEMKDILFSYLTENEIEKNMYFDTKNLKLTNKNTIVITKNDMISLIKEYIEHYFLSKNERSSKKYLFGRKDFNLFTIDDEIGDLTYYNNISNKNGYGFCIDNTPFKFSRLDLIPIPEDFSITKIELISIYRVKKCIKEIDSAIDFI